MKRLITLLAIVIMTATVSLRAEKNGPIIQQIPESLKAVESRFDNEPTVTMVYMGAPMLGKTRWPIVEKMQNMIAQGGMQWSGPFEVNQLEYMKVYTTKNIKLEKDFLKYIKAWKHAFKNAQTIAYGKYENSRFEMYAVYKDQVGSQIQQLLIYSHKNNGISLIVCGL